MERSRYWPCLGWNAALLGCALMGAVRGLDDGEKLFLQEVNSTWKVCEDYTNSSTCKGIECDSNDHIIKLFVPQTLSTRFLNLVVHF